MAPWKAYIPSLKEVHHVHKKDAPSGTAITLAEGIIKHSGKEHWSMEQASEETIRIKAEREGEVKGIHEVTYASETDTITLKHEAHTREGFALGAILAAEWLQNKKGVYSMKDVLQIE
jgi:4-hydroxy-tetrahydrodipicolinate reductase